jgi:hypothetical protein
MAAEVVTAMERLTRTAAARAADLTRLDERMAKVHSELRAARERLEETMADYRQGLFCSGCGKTKTEILKVGDKFPHPGQSIVRPTAAKIAAKEREMQQPVDRALRELQDVQTQRRTIFNERQEAFDQIDAGLSLWNTALAYQRHAIAHQRVLTERHHEEAKRALQNAVAGVGADGTQRQRESAKSVEARAALERRYLQATQASNAAQDRYIAKSREEISLLDTYLGRDPLPRVLIATPKIHAMVGTAAAFNALGGHFRMGSASEQGRGETVPRVENFIHAFRALPGPQEGVPLPGVARTPVSPSPQQLREMLKELAACAPEDASCQATPPP